MQKYHFRPYSPNQTILFPQRIDKDIEENDSVRLISSIVESLDLSGFRTCTKGTVLSDVQKGWFLLCVGHRA